MPHLKAQDGTSGHTKRASRRRRPQNDTRDGWAPPHHASVAEWRRAWATFGAALVTFAVTVGAAVVPLFLTGSIHAPMWLVSLEPGVAILAFLAGGYILLAPSNEWWLPGKAHQRSREIQRKSAEWSSDAIYPSPSERRKEALAKSNEHLATSLDRLALGESRSTRATRQSPRPSKRGQPPPPPSPESAGRG
jgi:hypothetical protein